MSLHPTVSPSVPPPLPSTGFGSQLPQLLPHEVLILEMGPRYAKYEKSRWIASLRRSAQLKCPLCLDRAIKNPRTIQQQVSTSPCEQDDDHLRIGQARGRLFITSERIIFVPKLATSPGWSVFVGRMSMLRTVVDGSGTPFFVAYFDDNILSVRYKDQHHAEAMVQVVANIRFENKLRHYLVPGYAHDDPPSYEASEDSLRLFFDGRLASRGKKGFSKLIMAAALGPQNIRVGPHTNKAGHAAHDIIYG